MGTGYCLFSLFGVLIYWLILNIKNYFLSKQNKRYYSFAELWKGQYFDGRFYFLVGFCVVMGLVALTIYLNW